MADVFEPQARRITDARTARILSDDDQGGPAYVAGADVWTPFATFPLPAGEPVTLTESVTVGYLYGTETRGVMNDPRLADAVSRGITEIEYTISFRNIENIRGDILIIFQTFTDAGGQTVLMDETSTFSVTSSAPGTQTYRFAIDPRATAFRVALASTATRPDGSQPASITFQITRIAYLTVPDGLPAPRYISAATDLNTLTEAGIYVRLSSTWRGINNPFQSGGFMVFVRTQPGIRNQNNGHIQQLAYSFRQNQIYFVRETPLGDGSSTDIPDTITADWQERDNYAATPVATEGGDIEVIAQEQTPSSTTQENQQAEFVVRGTGVNAFYADNNPLRPVTEARWFPPSFGVIAQQNQFRIVIDNTQLPAFGGYRSIIVGAPGQEQEYRATSSVSGPRTTVTAEIPDLLTRAGTLSWNILFNNGSYLYQNVQAGSKKIVRVNREAGQEWLQVPTQATPEQIAARSGAGTFISPDSLLEVTDDPFPVEVAHFSETWLLQYPADATVFNMERSADGRTLSHTFMIRRFEVGDLPDLRGSDDNGGSWLREFTQAGFAISEPTYRQQNGNTIQRTDITLTLQTWVGSAAAPNTLTHAAPLDLQEQIRDHHAVEELISTTADFADLELSRNGEAALEPAGVQRSGIALEYRLLIEITPATDGVLFGTDVRNFPHRFYRHSTRPFVFEHQLKHRITTNATSGGGDVDISGKADTDLSNVDSDLSDAEQTTFRGKVGAAANSALAGKADTNLQNIPTDLTGAQRTAIRTRIGAAAPGEGGGGDTDISGKADTDLSNVDSDLSDTEQLTFLGKVGASPLAVVSALSNNVDALTTAFTGKADINLQNISAILNDTQQNVVLARIAAARDDLSNLASNLTEEEQAAIQERLGIQGGGNGGAQGALIAPAPPSDGRNYVLGEIVPQPTAQTPNPAAIPGWVEYNRVLSALVVKILPDPELRELDDIVYLAGAARTRNDGPGIHRVIQNPDGPTNSIILTAGTDPDNNTEHGASIDAAAGGVYGEFQRNPNNALASFIWFSGTNSATSLRIRDDLIRPPTGDPEETTLTLTVGTNGGMQPIYGYLSGNFGSLSPATIGEFTIASLVAQDVQGNNIVEVQITGAPNTRDTFLSMTIEGREFLFADAERQPVLGQTNVYRWHYGASVLHERNEVVHVTFATPAEAPAVPPEIYARALRGADFNFGYSYDAAGDVTVGGVLYRHYQIASRAEGGPGVPSVTFQNVNDNDELAVGFYRTSNTSQPLALAPSRVWQWDDAPGVSGSPFLSLPPIDELPPIAEQDAGTLVFSQNQVYIAAEQVEQTIADRNGVTLATAGHRFARPGTIYAQNHSVIGRVVSDPSDFVAQFTWDSTNAEGTTGRINLWLRDDAATDLPSTLILRTMLWARTSVESFTLTRQDSTQFVTVSGESRRYRLFISDTTFYEDDRYFNGFHNTDFQFFTAYTSASNNTPLQIHPENLIVPAQWDIISRGRLGPNVLAATYTEGETTTGTLAAAIDFADNMSLQGAEEVIMVFTALGSDSTLGVPSAVARIYKTVYERYVADRTYQGFTFGATSREDYAIRITDTTFTPYAIARQNTRNRLDEIRGIF